MSYRYFQHSYNNDDKQQQKQQQTQKVSQGAFSNVACSRLIVAAMLLLSPGKDLVGQAWGGEWAGGGGVVSPRRSCDLLTWLPREIPKKEKKKKTYIFEIVIKSIVQLASFHA